MLTKNKKNFRPTDPNIFRHYSGNTGIFFRPNSKLKPETYITGIYDHLKVYDRLLLLAGKFKAAKQCCMCHVRTHLEIRKLI